MKSKEAKHHEKVGDDLRRHAKRAVSVDDRLSRLGRAAMAYEKATMADMDQVMMHPDGGKMPSASKKLESVRRDIAKHSGR